MMESLASSQERYMQSRYGQRGKHWAYTPEQGLMRLEPYKGQERLAAQEMLPATVFYFPSVIAEYEDAYKKPAYRRWIETNAKVEWGMMNVLGKSDVIPSAGRYLGDLVRFQTTVFTKMVVGDRSLDTFDDFVAEWRRRGGDVLLQEADTMQSIWKRVGVEE
jgi:putative aldouronate transport system substrate-binding protein